MKKVTSVVLMAAFIFSIASVASAQVGYGGRSGGSSASRAARITAVSTPAAGTPAGRVLGAATAKISTQIAQGGRGEAVSTLQEKLRAAGFFTYPTSTGFFGPLTLAAVKAFQAANGIPTTGFVGPLTLAALNK
jgi:peptidoglycan hydrolase-like protein with peptidoglycan-binding domain